MSSKKSGWWSQLFKATKIELNLNRKLKFTTTATKTVD